MGSEKEGVARIYCTLGGGERGQRVGYLLGGAGPEERAYVAWVSE